MKDFQKMWFGVIFLLLLIIAGANFYICHTENLDGNFYKVEIKRLADEIKKVGLEQTNIEKYPTIKKVEELELKGETGIKMQMENLQAFMEDSEYVCRFSKINGKYYRFDVEIEKNKSVKSILIRINILLFIILVGIFLILWFIKRKIIAPFERIREVPYELAKGNLIIPLASGKSKYFGDFVWGLNLLREHLEQQKEQCLSMQKEKSTLLLSLSHDIKIPLSAIKLYVKALLKNLYSSKEKQREVIESINEKVDEIEAFLNQIIHSTSKEFMEFTVEEEEFYLSEVIQKLEKYYKDKLSYQHIEFSIASYDNCLLKGDKERFIEVLENIMENAIKYGDGRKIFIEFSQEEDCQLVWITNSGNSLSEQEIAHVFDSFWRGSNTQGIEGSGLGLSICQKLMGDMKGDIFALGSEDSMTVTVVIPRV